MIRSGLPSPLISPRAVLEPKPMFAAHPVPSMCVSSGVPAEQLEYRQSVLMLPAEQDSVPLVQVMVSDEQVAGEVTVATGYSVAVLPGATPGNVPPPWLAVRVQPQLEYWQLARLLLPSQVSTLAVQSSV